jgi:hypothetical protein
MAHFYRGTGILPVNNHEQNDRATEVTALKTHALPFLFRVRNVMGIMGALP